MKYRNVPVHGHGIPVTQLDLIKTVIKMEMKMRVKMEMKMRVKTRGTKITQVHAYDDVC